MSDHVYKMVELVGSSETSIEDAIQTAIKRASQTLRNLHARRSRMRLTYHQGPCKR